MIPLLTLYRPVSVLFVSEHSSCDRSSLRLFGDVATFVLAFRRPTHRPVELPNCCPFEPSAKILDVVSTCADQQLRPTSWMTVIFVKKGAM